MSAAESARLAEWRRRVGRAAVRLYAVLADLDEMAERLAAEVPRGAAAPRLRDLDGAEDAAALRRGDAVGRHAVPTDPFAALAALLPLRQLRPLVMRLARLAARPGQAEGRRVAHALAEAAPEALEVLASRAAAWRDDEPSPAEQTDGQAPADPPLADPSSAEPWPAGDAGLATDLERLLACHLQATAGGLHRVVPVTTSGQGRGVAAALWRDVAARQFTVDPEAVLQAALGDDLPYLDPRGAAEAGLVVLPLYGRWLAAWRDGSVDPGSEGRTAGAWRLSLLTRNDDGSLRLDDLP